MEEREQARLAVEAARRVVKSTMNNLRTCQQFLAEVDGRLGALEDAELERSRANNGSHPQATTPVR